MPTATSYLSRIRGVELLPGERVAAILHPEQGLIAEPVGSGRLLAATNRRVISVVEDGSTRVAQMYAMASVCGVGVRNDVRRGLSWVQWAVLVLGAVVAYLVLAYWLVDRLPSVIIPVINLHAVAAILVILIALAVWLLWRSMTHSGGSLVRIEGLNWSLDVPCAADCYEDSVAFAGVLLSMQDAASGQNRQQMGNYIVVPAKASACGGQENRCQ